MPHQVWLPAAVLMRSRQFHSHRQCRQPLVLLYHVLRGVRLDLRVYGWGPLEIGRAGITLKKVSRRLPSIGGFLIDPGNLTG